VKQFDGMCSRLDTQHLNVTDRHIYHS